jgi:hypothetical protein
MGLGLLKYINHFYSLYILNMGHKPHKCMHNKSPLTCTLTKLPHTQECHAYSKRNHSFYRSRTKRGRTTMSSDINCWGKKHQGESNKSKLIWENLLCGTSTKRLFCITQLNKDTSHNATKMQK